MSRHLLQAFVIGLTIASGASAQCPGTAQPFGPDDSGLLTCNKDTSKCEQTVAGNVATTLVPGLIKCQSDQANLAFKGFPNFEDIGCVNPVNKKRSSARNRLTNARRPDEGLAQVSSDGGQELLNEQGVRRGGCELGPIPNKPGKSAVERFNACANAALNKGGADCAPCQAANLPNDHRYRGHDDRRWKQLDLLSVAQRGVPRVAG